MTLDAGHIVLLPFPHTDLRSSKQRPALVLTAAGYNQSAPDFIAAYVTSQPQDSTWSITLAEKNLREGRLVKASWIRPDRLATLEQRLIKKVVARLDEETLADGLHCCGSLPDLHATPRPLSNR